MNAREKPFDFLGKNLTTPFRRDKKNDFAHGQGLQVVRSSVRTILGTRRAGVEDGIFIDGQVPFNQKLGTLVALLRHRNINDPAVNEIAHYYVERALAEQEPRITITNLSIRQEPRSRRITIAIKYNLVDRSGNPEILQEDLFDEVEL